MEIKDINKEIINLTKIYDNINERWANDPCCNEIYQVFRQEKYKDYHESAESSNLEKIVLELITKSLNEKILSRLRTVIEQNISIYETRQDEFNKVDFYTLRGLDDEYQFKDRLERLKRDKKDIQEYPYPTENERELLLKENQKEINDIHNERNDYKRSRKYISENYYLKIYELSRSFINILNSYFPFEKQNIQFKQTPIPISGKHFDMELISKIHKACNNIQFEQITELDLYDILNERATNAQLILKDGETIRMCYLIHKLYEYMKSENKSNWRNYILTLLGIDEKTYKSKYREPTLDIASRKNKEFVEKINPIFK